MGLITRVSFHHLCFIYLVSATACSQKYQIQKSGVIFGLALQNKFLLLLSFFGFISCGLAPVSLVPSIPMPGQQELKPVQPNPEVIQERESAHLESKKSLNLLKPVLAVRGISCLLCHASITGNVLTDFAKGSTLFAPTSLSDPLSPHAVGDIKSPYLIGGAGWSSIKRLTGSLIIPKMNIDLDLKSKLLQIMEQRISHSALTLEPTTWPIGFDPSQKIIEKQDIVIRPPLKQDMTELLGQGSEVQIFKLSANSQVEGFSVIAQKYVINEGISFCEGDIGIRGILLLRNLKLKTTSKGCRLYVSETVFINGSLEYQGSDEEQNLQIASSKAIMMGYGPKPFGLTFFDTQGEDAGYFRGSNGFGHKSWYLIPRGGDVAGAEQILEDIDHDASKVQSSLREESQYQSITLSHLLLTAPHVHTRYTGLLKGVLIAELALNPLKQFNFEYDPVFIGKDILPLLRHPLIEVID